MAVFSLPFKGVPMESPVQRLNPGNLFSVMGHIHAGVKRFSINLVTGGGDIALHVNPRFDGGQVVYNSLRGGHWEQEERTQGLPVNQGHNFEAMILVEPMSYKVWCNISCTTR